MFMQAIKNEVKNKITLMFIIIIKCTAAPIIFTPECEQVNAFVYQLQNIKNPEFIS